MLYLVMGLEFIGVAVLDPPEKSQVTPNTRMQRTRSSPSALRSPLMRCPLGGPKLFLWAKAGVGWCLVLVIVGLSAPAIGQERDFDTPHFEDARRTLLTASADPTQRVLAVQEVVIRNAVEARPLLVSVLADSNPEVRREAAWWLAAYGDTRGLDIQAACFENPKCPSARESAQLLSVARRPEYRSIIRGRVEGLFRAGIKGSTWQGPPVSASLLTYGTIALARIGAKEDADLIIKVVRSRPPNDNRLLEALGHVPDARAQDMLWSAHKELLREPRCDVPGLGVEALLPLSRLGDPVAIQKMKDVLLGVGVPECPPFNGWPILSADGASAFGGLRSEDATAFAETVMKVAAQDPEGAGTRQAWVALGIMHPQGYGERVLELAVSRRPHWKYVSRDFLNKVVIALDPNLNTRFWSNFEVEVVPDMRGAKALVTEGLGRVNFEGSRWWTSD